MGIRGIYPEIGPGERVALSKLAVDTYEQTGRPLRLAIDTSIWLFQIQSSKGGTNPALRTFYYRLLRLISLSIHPLFVFDGPNKPPFKRNKRTGPNVASIPEFLAKQLLKHFGLPFHLAPGEAEAECALLQRRGIVDAVLSEDVDTLMFGSGLTLRNWSAEGKVTTPTHVNVYDAQKTKSGPSGLDRDGMILVALMSGGDYIPEGIPGCGPKTACEAARAGFGKDLCALSQDDASGVAKWKERLCHELKTNEAKLFRTKHKSLVIPEDFPRVDVLRYYTHPCLSSEQRLARLKDSLKWDADIDFKALRTFTAEAFDWRCLGGAKKFIRNLAPALLVKQLRLRALENQTAGNCVEDVARSEKKLVKHLYSKRNHHSTDGAPEIRVGYMPAELVDIDLNAEDPDPDEPSALLDSASLDSDEEDDTVRQADAPPGEEPKRRRPSTYDPTKLDRVWILATYVKVGVPLKMEDWEASFRDAKQYEASKSRKRAEAARKKSANGGMPLGALDRFTTVTKPGAARGRSSSLDPSSRAKSTIESVIDLVSSPEKGPPPRKRQFQRSHSDTSALRVAGSNRTTTRLESIADSEVGEASSFNGMRKGETSTKKSSPTKVDSTPRKRKSEENRQKRTPVKETNAIVISSSPATPSSAQRQITDFLLHRPVEPTSPSRNRTGFVRPMDAAGRQTSAARTLAFRLPLHILKGLDNGNRAPPAAEVSNGTCDALESPTWTESDRKPRENLKGSWKAPECNHAAAESAVRKGQVEIMDLTML